MSHGPWAERGDCYVGEGRAKFCDGGGGGWWIGVAPASMVTIYHFVPRSGFQPSRNGVATTRPWAALATSGFWKIGKRKEAWTVLAPDCH